MKKIALALPFLMLSVPGYGIMLMQEADALKNGTDQKAVLVSQVNTDKESGDNTCNAPTNTKGEYQPSLCCTSDFVDAGSPFSIYYNNKFHVNMPWNNNGITAQAVLTCDTIKNYLNGNDINLYYPTMKCNTNKSLCTTTNSPKYILSGYLSNSNDLLQNHKLTITRDNKPLTASNIITIKKATNKDKFTFPLNCIPQLISQLGGKSLYEKSCQVD